MVEFIVKHKLINTSQYGFLKARSCLTNLLCFLEEITKWVDDGSSGQWMLYVATSKIVT